MRLIPEICIENLIHYNTYMDWGFRSEPHPHPLSKNTIILGLDPKLIELVFAQIIVYCFAYPFIKLITQNTNLIFKNIVRMEK
jgi:hypothetical protein